MSRLAALLALLILLVAPVSTVTPAHAAVEPVRWSDPATWDGEMPVEGDVVTIPAGKHVLMDVSPPPLAGLQVDGTLTLADVDLEIRTDWVLVHGAFRAGSAGQPFLHRASIVLTDVNPGEDLHGMGDKVIGVMAGELELFGEARGPSWTRLISTASPGDRRILVEGAVDWRPGDRIVISSTDFDKYQAEEVTVAAVDGRVVELEEELVYPHWGEDERFGDWTLSERAEVGLLSRNIVISAEDAEDGYGGHVMVMGGSARIEGVELVNMEQAGELARYPIHFHLLGDRPDAFVRHSAIHHSFNRCITIHGTNGVLLEGNVAYDTLGHCYFMEDGVETGNRLIGNLGLLTRTPEEARRLLPSDAQPATFWITNPANEVVGNVAAGSDAMGFWYALPEHPTGLSGSAETDAQVWPRRTPLLAFVGNTAHSNGSRGLHVDDGPTGSGETEVTVYDPRERPVPPGDGEEESSSTTAVFDQFTSYKNRERGVWLRGVNHVLRDPILADNAIGATFASYESFIEGGLVVGESANKGMAADWEEKGLDGRTLPFPWEPSFPIRGYEFYDGVVGARDVTFAGFIPNEQRRASGLGFLLDDEFPLSPENSVAGARWLDDSNRVYIRAPKVSADGSKTSVFVDRDGSVTGAADQVVVANVPFVRESGCAARPDWNAFICDLSYVGLAVSNIEDEPGWVGSVTLTRTDGDEVSLIGVPSDEGYPRTEFHASVIEGDAYRVSPLRVPDRLRIALYAPEGSEVLVTVKVTGEGAYVYGDYNWSDEGALGAAGSAEEVAASDGWVAYAGDGHVVLRLVVPEGAGEVVRDICARPNCG